MKTKIEIIYETVAYYSKNPRSVVPGSNTCMYLVEETGAKCAFSRCCTDQGVIDLHDFFEGVGVQSFDEFDIFLKEEYKGHEIDFWDSIQALHDIDEYWANGSLTKLGEMNLKMLLITIKLKS